MNLRQVARLNRLCQNYERRVVIARAYNELHQERKIGDYFADEAQDHSERESHADLDSSDRKD